MYVCMYVHLGVFGLLCTFARCLYVCMSQYVFWHLYCFILWTMLTCLIDFAVLNINTQQNTSSTPLTKMVYLHPPSADLIVLPDGRYLAYKEQGVSAERSRFSMIVPHMFLSSRLAGCTIRVLKAYKIIWIILLPCILSTQLDSFSSFIIFLIRNTWTYGFTAGRVRHSPANIWSSWLWREWSTSEEEPRVISKGHVIPSKFCWHSWQVLGCGVL